MTNNDKINNMSIEEKVEFFGKLHICQLCVFRYNKCLYHTHCKDGIKKYLESEVEE